MTTPKQNARLLNALAIVLSMLVLGSVIVSSDQSKAIPSTATSPSPGLVSDAPNVPNPNSPLKFGLYTNVPNIQPVNKLLNHKLNIMAWFIHWNGTVVNNKLAYACTNGYVPEITWESWGGTGVTSPYPLTGIATGQYDNLIKTQLQDIHTVCKNQTVVIRFDHEMDLQPGFASWYPWQGNPQQYIAAWQHVVSMGRSIDPNIKWLWSPNRGTATAVSYYPGAKWVDYVGLTLNHEHLATEEQYLTFAQFYQANQEVIESFNKPIIIGETSSDESIGNKSEWVKGMFAYAATNHKITALVWFNGVTETGGYSFDSSVATLNAFQQSLANLTPKKTTHEAAKSHVAKQEPAINKIIMVQPAKNPRSVVAR